MATGASTNYEDRRRVLGARGEQLAAEHFGRLGFAMVGRNVRSARGEIDLIVYDGHTLAFVEVKTTCTRAQAPLSRIAPRQRRRLRQLAATWLAQTKDRPHARELRFDAVGVQLDGHGRLLCLDHIENAW